jgi:hypothetical protein
MNTNKVFTIKASVWLYPGLPAGGGRWHFVTLDKELSAQIKKVYPKGFVKIEATIGESTWRTSLFPHTQSQAYLLCIKTSIRKQEGIYEGDRVTVSIKLLQ